MRISWFSFLCVPELYLLTPTHRLSPLCCPISPNFFTFKNGIGYAPHVTFVSAILFCAFLLTVASLSGGPCPGLILCTGQQYQIRRKVERAKDEVYVLESTVCLLLDGISAALISVFRWTVYMSPNKTAHIAVCGVPLISNSPHIHLRKTL